MRSRSRVCAAAGLVSVLVVLVLVTVAGCTGGGDGDGETAPTEATDSPPETVPRSGTATGREGQNPRPSGRGACQTEDVIGAAKALRASGRPEIDGDRIGLLGRSMGGGVVYNTLVVAPGLFDAAVVFAPVSSRPAENIDHFQRPDNDPTVAEIEAAHGTPASNPTFWREVSPLTYVDRVTEPLLIHHGTADDTCPLAWTERTTADLKSAGKDVRLIKYPGEGHTFGPQWPTSMNHTMTFFTEHLR